MSALEFSTVLVSIVVAIAITEIVATWGRTIRLPRGVRPYRVHGGWMGLVLLLAIPFRRSVWDLREGPDWNFFESPTWFFLLFVLVTVGSRGTGWATPVAPLPW